MPASLITRLVSAAVLALALPAAAHAQYENGYPERVVDLAGPRFGFTMLSSGITAKLKEEHDISIAPFITQFGWQMEKQFQSRGSDVAALTELVILVGGLEQNVALPSASWIIGARTKSGFEFGVGPNATPLSVAIVYVAGMTYKVGALNVPLNVSVVPSVNGVRVSMITGFNMEMFRNW